MLWPVAVVLCFVGTRVLSAPTVHLTKLEDGEPVPGYQQLFPTDPPPIADPVWMTVTMRPSVYETSVEPLGTHQFRPTTPTPLRPSFATPYQPGSAGFVPPLPTNSYGQPSVSYTPYYFREPSSPLPSPGYPQLHHQHVAVASPHYQYHYQNNLPVAWNSVFPQPAQPLPGHVQPCVDSVVSVPLPGYQQTGY